jgi:hypothetical protein
LASSGLCGAVKYSCPFRVKVGYMNWKPIQPLKDQTKAVRIDPEKPGLVIIEIPLDRMPEPEWCDFIENPSRYLKEWTPSVNPVKVSGDKIQVRADKKTPGEALKWTYKYIELANERYLEFLREKEAQERQEIEARGKSEKELEEITKRIRTSS